MPKREVYESDYSQELMLDENQVVQGIVQEHPDLPEGIPRRTYMTEAELAKLQELSIKSLVVIDVQRRSDLEAEPERFVLTEKEFAKLAQGRKIGEILAEAAPVVQEPARRERRSRSDAPNYETPDLAGAPHKGKASPEEARLVRENLEAVNERLRANGQRTIDPEDTTMAKRYGFDGSMEQPAAPPELTVVTETEDKPTS